jgi:hypothetical protein
MAYKVFDRVKQKCSVIGATDPITIGNSILGYKRFDNVLNDGDTFHYMVINITNGEWEAGLGTYDAIAQTIAREAVSSSNSDAAVVFSPGEKEVFISALVENLTFRDPATARLTVGSNLSNLALGSDGKLTLYDTVSMPGNIKDSTGSIGTNGQALTSTPTGIAWQDNNSYLIKTFNIVGSFNVLLGTARFVPVQNTTIRSIIMTVDFPVSGGDLIVGLYRNGIAVDFFSIPQGSFTQKYTGLNYPIQIDESYTVSVVSGGSRNFAMSLFNINL